MGNIAISIISLVFLPRFVVVTEPSPPSEQTLHFSAG